MRRVEVSLLARSARFCFLLIIKSTYLSFTKLSGSQHYLNIISYPCQHGRLAQDSRLQAVNHVVSAKLNGSLQQQQLHHPKCDMSHPTSTHLANPARRASSFPSARLASTVRLTASRFSCARLNRYFIHSDIVPQTRYLKA